MLSPVSQFLLFTILSGASFKANKNNGQQLFRTYHGPNTVLSPSHALAHFIFIRTPREGAEEQVDGVIATATLFSQAVSEAGQTV